MKIIYKIVTIFFVLLLILSFSSCSINTASVKTGDYITDTKELVYSGFDSQGKKYELALSEEDKQKLSEYEVVAESEFLKLFYCKESTYIAVADKRTQKVWYSVSTELETDSVLQADTKNLMLSVLQIEYKELQTFKTINSYKNSVEDGNFKAKEIENGICVDYVFTDMTKSDAKDLSTQQKKVTPKKLFEVSVEYTLQNDSLVVNIPLSKVYYEKDYPLLSVRLLQDFGSTANTENGYIFVPDGSGALISFDKLKKNISPFLSQVYGFDKSLEVKKRPELVYNSTLPVFGMNDNNNGFLAIIEDGDAFASIAANAAGMLSERSQVYPVFQTLSNQNISIGAMEGESKFISVQEKMYQGNIRVRYAFLPENSSSYVEMAKYYRNYLIKTKGLEKLEENEALPFNLELIGSINKVQSTLGIKYNGVESLTTFSEAEDILKNLMKNGVSNINIKYSGWFNGGLDQEYAGKFGVEKTLGGLKGLKKLNTFAEKNNLQLFPAMEFLTTPSKSSGYNRLKMAAKQLDQNAAKYYEYDTVSLLGSGYREILNPATLNKSMNEFIKNYSKSGIKALCIDDLGSEVFADYTKSNVFNRQSAVNLYSELLEKTKKDVGSVMSSGAYAYASDIANIILNAPTSSSGYQITDKSVPFYAIVYHGYKDYSAAPLNESASINDEVLNYVEQGAIPYFKIMNADGSLTKNTEYSYLCSNSYSIWKDQISDIYSEMKDVLSPVRTMAILNYEDLAEKVTKITYENGKYIIVNRSDADFDYQNQTIESKSYKLMEGESK